MALPSRGDVVRCLLASKRPQHARDIAEKCRVNEASYNRFLELLDTLSLEGTVIRTSGNRYKAQPEDALGGKKGRFEGVLSMHPRGFGFVSALDHDDLFIAPDGIGAAMHGDTVSVSVIGRNKRGSEGTIHRVVKRREAQIPGLLRRSGRSSWLEPDDARVRGPIVLKLDRKSDAKNGDAAVVRITRHPESADENPEGELVAILGTPGDPHTEVAKILMREEISEEHTPEATKEAEVMAAKLRRASTEGRMDLRDVPLPTIDPEDARDHDDALWVERTTDGYRAWIAIADVSEYVQPDTALDTAALERGCTVYLPDRAIPMLPSALAADLCSLMPDRDRLCLCVIADLDRQGKVKRFKVVEGIMRSAAMLTYPGVARTLGFTDKPPRSTQAEAMKKGLKTLDDLARKLRKRRMGRGALDLDLPEPKLTLDDEGMPVDCQRRSGDPGIKRAYQMVEEMMLLANELVAQWLAKRKCPAVYRIHGRPDEEKLERLGKVAEVLGVKFDLDAAIEPLGLGKWRRSIAGHEKKNVLEMFMLRSLKQATYDIINIGHFGLASDAYVHFTSPIRRYPDVLVHRAVKNILRGGKPDTRSKAIDELKASAANSSSRERKSMDVEREVMDLYRTYVMKDRIDEVFDGTVAAIVGSGIFVSLDDPFVDVMVRYEDMGPDRYEQSDDELSVVGLRSGDTIELGDRVTLVVEDISLVRRQVYGKRIAPEHVLDDMEDSRGRRGRGRRGDDRGSRRSDESRRGREKSSRGAATRGRADGKKTTGRSSRASSQKKAAVSAARKGRKASTRDDRPTKQTSGKSKTGGRSRSTSSGSKSRSSLSSSKSSGSSTRSKSSKSGGSTRGKKTSRRR